MSTPHNANQQIVRSAWSDIVAGSMASHCIRQLYSPPHPSCMPEMGRVIVYEPERGASIQGGVCIQPVSTTNCLQSRHE
jgi:hypothetical protein